MSKVIDELDRFYLAHRRCGALSSGPHGDELWEADLVARSQAATTEAERVHAAAAEKIAEANAAEGRLKGAQDELAALFANVKR